jgi:hypothetical protein
MTGAQEYRDMLFVLESKVQPRMGLSQLREVWTKNFKNSPAEEDDVEEDDVEMTVQRGGSGEESRVEDPFEKQMCLTYESQVRVSTAQRYGKTQVLDQLEDWIKENPIPHTSNAKFSKELSPKFRYS